MRSSQTNNAIARSLSPDRLTKYLTAAGGDLDLAIALYERNTRLAEAFYTPLQAMEVYFRNHLDQRMAAKYGADWMTNNSPPLSPNSTRAIIEAQKGLAHARVKPTPGAMVAELNFWFWVGLLGPGYDATIWRATCHHAFRTNGKGMARSVVHGRFNAMRRFRNRVAHHEPIFRDNLAGRHDEIIEAIHWMCRDTAAWAAHHSRLLDALAASP